MTMDRASLRVFLFILLVTVGPLIAVNSEPTVDAPTLCSNCNCRCDDWRRQVDCSGLGLHAFPNSSCIPQNTMDLLMTHNSISYIADDTWINIPFLNNLDLSNNNLSTTLKLPGSLSYFWAVQNQITDISKFFQVTSNMIMIDLSYNLIPFISNGTFISCSNTVTMWLADNLIEYVERGGWDGLNSLAELRLENNPITSLNPDFMFGLTDRLHSLFFEGSSIKRLQPGTFSKLQKLMILKLKDNKIESYPGNTFIPGHPNSHVMSLYLNQNDMKWISPRAFAGLAVIDRLYMSRNLLTLLPPELFANVSITTSLDLSDNQFIDLPDAFLKSSPDLKVLYLYQNNIETITASILQGLISLSDLYLFQNNITTITPNAFYETEVKKLYLFGNKLTTITHETFQTHGKSLELVNLFYNKIESISNNAFDHFKLASTVKLSCQNLRSIPKPAIDVNIVLEGQDFDTSLNVESDVGDDLAMSGFNCSNGFDMKTCKLCPVGCYGNRLDPGCIKCPAGGFYQDKRGQSANKPRGMKCEQCNPGTYVPRTFAPGKNIGDCQVCPTGTNKSIHAGFRACPCLYGYFRRDRFGACERCPSKGVDCSNEFQQLKPGYWWTFDFDSEDSKNNENLKRYQCYAYNLVIGNSSYNSNCTEFTGALPKPFLCPTGPEACPVKGDPVNASCADGYEGWLCSQCSSDYYSWFEYCLKCPQVWHFVLEILGLLIISIVFVAVGVWDYKRRKDGTRSVIDILVARFKIVLGYYQVTGTIFTSLHNIKWPNEVSALGDLFRLLELNMFKLVAKPRCYFQNFNLDVYREYLVGVSFCVCVCVLAALVYVVNVIYYMYLQRNTRQPLPRQLQRTKSRCYLFVVLMLFITYLSVCNIVMGLLPAACYTLCLDENDDYCTSRLRGDLSIDCDSSKHKTYASVAYASLLYVVGFPVILLILLMKHSWQRVSKPNSISKEIQTDGINQEDNDQLTEDNIDLNGNRNDNFEEGTGSSELVAGNMSDTLEQMTQTTYDNGGVDIEDIAPSEVEPLTEDPTLKKHDYPLYLRFLCENYKAKFWFWEIFELMRKVLQTVLVVLFGSKDSLTLGVTIGLSVIFLTSHAYFKPMKDRFEHWLQMVSLAAIFFNLLLASMLLIPEPETGAGDYREVGMAVFLITVNSLVILMAVGNTVLMIWKSLMRHRAAGTVCNVSCYGCLASIPTLVGVFGSLAGDLPRERRNRYTEYIDDTEPTNANVI